jgi:hypothetical protein
MNQQIGPNTFVSTSAFVDNPDAQLQRTNTAIRGGVLEQIQGGAAGYQPYEICAENVAYIHNNVTVTTVGTQLDSRETFANTVACSDNSPAGQAQRQAFAAGDYSAVGSGGYLEYMLGPNNPVVAMVEIENNTLSEMSREAENQEKQLDWGDGVLPTETCANPSDPYCRAKRVNTPGAVNSVNIQAVQLAGWDALGSADEFGENPSSESASLQLDTVTSYSGLLGYNTDGLRSPLIAPIQKLQQGSQEFLWSIEQYFDVTDDTRDWAANSVLYTWDNVQHHAQLEKYLADVVLLENL